MDEQRFPVLWQVSRERQRAWEALGCPRTVPWSILEPHEAQARSNHDQTLQRLAERGGLSPAEIVAVIEGHGLRWLLSGNVTDEIAVPTLLRYIEAHNAKRTP